MFVVHNYQQFEHTSQIKAAIKLDFNEIINHQVESYPKNAQDMHDKAIDVCNDNYFSEKMIDNKREYTIKHFIIGSYLKEAGNYYNKTTLKFLYNSLNDHGVKKSYTDIID